MSWWKCEAGQVLLRQVDRAYRNRDKSSDGTVGDASHQASPSDHNPCWRCLGDRYGVVRAVDIDASFGGGPLGGTSEHAWKMANQLRLAMVGGDKRVSYVIAWDPSRGRDFIASMNPAYSPLGTWRDYDGGSHMNHVHVSFTAAGDFGDRPFHLPALDERDEQRRRLRRAIDAGKDQVAKIRRRLARYRRRLRRLVRRHAWP
jgi:hypothetical protein